jgi:predicted kinase
MADGPVLLLVTGLPGTGKSTLAERIAPALGAPVLGWDWVMGALTPYDPVQDALRGMGHLDHRAVGWSLLWQMARAQLGRGQSVVLDGVARDTEAAGTRRLAADCGARSLVVMTTCPDEAEHRRRIEGRRRGIPGWHELTWESVESTRARFDPPGDVDLVIDGRGETDDAVAAVLALALTTGP